MKPSTLVLMWTSFALFCGGGIAAVLASQIDCGTDEIGACVALQMQAWQVAAVVLTLGAGLGISAIAVADAVSDRESGSTPGAP